MAHRSTMSRLFLTLLLTMAIGDCVNGDTPSGWNKIDATTKEAKDMVARVLKVNSRDLEITELQKQITPLKVKFRAKYKLDERTCSVEFEIGPLTGDKILSPPSCELDKHNHHPHNKTKPNHPQPPQTIPPTLHLNLPKPAKPSKRPYQTKPAKPSKRPHQTKPTPPPTTTAPTQKPYYPTNKTKPRQETLTGKGRPEMIVLPSFVGVNGKEPQRDEAVNQAKNRGKVLLALNTLGECPHGIKVISFIKKKKNFADHYESEYKVGGQICFIRFKVWKKTLVKVLEGPKCKNVTYSATDPGSAQPGGSDETPDTTELPDLIAEPSPEPSPEPTPEPMPEPSPEPIPDRIPKTFDPNVDVCWRWQWETKAKGASSPNYPTNVGPKGAAGRNKVANRRRVGRRNRKKRLLYLDA